MLYWQVKHGVSTLTFICKLLETRRTLQCSAVVTLLVPGFFGSKLSLLVRALNFKNMVINYCSLFKDE